MRIYRVKRVALTLSSKILNSLNLALHGVQFGSGFKSCGVIFFRKSKTGKIILGNNIHINSHLISDPIGGDTKTILIAGDYASLILHDNVSISNATIFATKHIEIGESTCIGGGVKIYDTDFHSSVADKRLNGNVDVPSASVNIGKRVFIGGHSIILKGVTIGDESVIGAGSVITKNIPAGEIWAGNPAKFIKKTSSIVPACELEL